MTKINNRIYEPGATLNKHIRSRTRRFLTSTLIAIAALSISLPITAGAARYAAENSQQTKPLVLAQTQTIALTDAHDDACARTDHVAIRGDHRGCWHRDSESTVAIHWIKSRTGGYKFSKRGYPLSDFSFFEK